MAADRLATLGTGAALLDSADEEPAPERIGAYRITERIDQGGMGPVYRSERGTGDFAGSRNCMTDRRDAAWMGARSEVRRAQLVLATRDQDADAMARLAGLLDAQIEERPVRMRNGYAAKFDRANAAHCRRIRLYFTDELAESLPEPERAQAGFRQLAHTRPNDPLVLYMLAFIASVGFGAAEKLDPCVVEVPETARGSSEQLLKLELRDHTLEGFAIKIRSADAQSLSARGRTAEALAIHRGVVAYYEVKAVGKRGDAGLNQLTTAHVVLGNIAVSAKDRALACENHRLARGDIAGLERSGAAMGYVAEHKAGLDGNLRLCASGASVAALEVLD